jgi:hypothetical protein
MRSNGWRGLCTLLAAIAMIAAADDLRALYDKALKAFYAERYDEAESGFATVYRLGPSAPFAPDAAFKAGEAAFRQEHFEAATQHFAHYLRVYPLGRSAAEARERLAAARAKTGDMGELPLPAMQTTWPRLLVAWVDQIPGHGEAEVERYFATLAKLGYNAVAVGACRTAADAPLFRGAPNDQTGAYFRTQSSPVAEDRLGELVASAHKFGLRLIAVLPVRSLTAGLPDEELDRRWDSVAPQPVADRLHVDLFAAEAFDRLARIAQDAAAAGPDAIWLGPDFSFAPDEGVSAGALEEVAKALQREVKPAELFAELTPDAGGRLTRGGNALPYAAFCEVRSRQAARAAARMIDAVKQRHPSCRLGVIVDSGVAEDSLVGLRDAAVDLEALAALPVEDLVMDFEPRAFRVARGLTGEKAYASMTELSARFKAAVRREARGVVALRALAAGGSRTMPRWEIDESVAALLGAGAFGVALWPPDLSRPVTDLLTAKAESRTAP